MTTPRVMVIGWDGATFDIVRPLIAQGRMPVLARFMVQGASGRLESTIPAVTPVAWTTMTTGCNPGKHGIFDGHQLDPVSGRVRFASAAMRKVPPIWSLLSGAGKRTAVLNVPVTYPPDRVNGVLIPGMFAPPGAPDAIYPADFGRAFEKRFGRHADSPPKFDDPLRYLHSLLTGVEHRCAMVEHLLDREPWDFLFAVFMETDRVQHFFWKYRDPAHPRHAELGDAIERVYQALDTALGRIMDTAGSGVTFALVSDHGAGPLHTGVFLNRWLMDNGLLALTEPVETMMRPERRSALGSLARKAAVRLGLTDRVRAADDLNNRFRSAIDWDATLAYSDGMGGGIHFNHARLDAAGRDELTFAIHNGLLDLKGPNGDAVITAVARREDVYAGPEVPGAPDLLVECAPGYQVYAPHEFLLHGAGDPASLFVSHPWCGRHERYGLFLLHGPGVRPGADFDECAMIDVTPTLLALMHGPIPAYMDGTPVARALAVPVPDPATSPAAHGAPAGDPHAGDNAPDKDQDAAMKQQLKDLGYM
jgi:predicted AlkP superfamily phosphohydrolase/phosphomutase